MRRIGTTENYMLFSGFLTLANQGIVSAGNFLTGVIIGRSCTKDEFGLYMLGFSIVLFILDLQFSLISTPYMVYSPRLKGQELRLYAGSSLIHQSVLTMLVILVLAGWERLVSLGLGPAGLGPVFRALALSIAFIMLREFVRRLCFADLRVAIALIFDICVTAMQTGGVLLLARFGLLAASRVFWVTGCACGCAAAGWLFLNRKAFLPRRMRAISDFKTNWTLDKWIVMSAMLWAVSMNLYPWLLTFFQGTAAAGVWGACLGTLAVVNVPLMGLQNFLGPKIANVYAEGGTGALRRFTFQISALVCSVTTVLCCALFLFGGPLLVALYGDKYRGNGPVVFVLALGLIASAVAFFFSRALFVLERADADFKINFVPLFVLFSFGLWLVRSYGPLGAACGLLLANVAASAGRCACFAVLSRPSGEEGAR